MKSPPTLYDVEGSAHWFNKPDHGIVIYSPKPDADEALIRICKVRFEETGEKGEVRMGFDRLSARFMLLDDSPASSAA
jgi:twinkle protein